jgi:hypothetical protein
MTEQQRQEDVERILGTQHDNGGEYWSTPDGGIAKGSPFSSLECGILLSELGYDPQSPEMRGIADLAFGNMKEDGRIKAYATGTVYPCQTALAARTLCYLGHAKDARLAKTYEYFLGNRHTDGGWRCNASKFGHGPETKCSNPGPTLMILDVFRFTPSIKSDRLDTAVEFLLRHWETKAPIGPCHYGIGHLFMQVEFPMLRYNIFYYVYVLSFYDKAKRDPRFLEAFAALSGKLVGGEMPVENPNRKLSDYNFCRKNSGSELATRRYREIVKNIGERR